MISRRRIIAGAGAAAAWPIVAQAQKPALPTIGFLNVESAESYTRPLTGFLEGLREAGYVEGQNVAIEYRWADGKADRLPALAADLVRRNVAVIAATSTPAALAAKAATTTIPVVFETGGDPVQLGLVASLNRPGGNVTGVTQLAHLLAPKGLEALHEIVPLAKTMALLVNPAVPEISGPIEREVLAAASKIHLLKATSDREIENVFAELARLRAEGLVIASDALFNSRADQLGTLTLRHAVPAVYARRDFAAAGGLLSYGNDIADAYRLAGVYTGRILKGDRPADLPVQRTTKAELYINLKTAKVLGLTVPLSLLGRADEVIE